MVCMVMFFYFSKRTLQTLSDNVYRYLLIAVAVCVSLDITSVIAINLNSILPPFLIDLINKAYVISICTVAFSTRIYVLRSITHKKLSLNQKIGHFIPLAIDIVLSLLLPIYYYIGDGKLYSYGTVIYITYITVAIYLLTSVYYIVRRRKEINSHDFRAISFLLTSWIITALLQFIKNEWLLVGFAMSAAMVFMYFCLENPAQNIDGLTGLFNQTAFYQYIESLCYEKRNFVLILLNIEDMRFINETFGIHNTDVFLQDIAKYLDSGLGGKVFRDSGSRFSLVFEENISEASKKTVSIRERFEKPWEIANLEYYATVCIVEMEAALGDFIPEKVVELGRYFVSKAKKAGKGIYLKVSEDDITEKEKNSLVEKCLKRAIEKKDIQVYYQPIYSMEEGRYVSAEALTRIVDENGEFIKPDLFIQVAEQNGMILELGMLIFEEVCQFIHTNRLKERGLRYIEINLSVVQCMREKLAEELLAVMEQYNIEPEFINLEITETAAANSDLNLKRNMERLIEKGVTFALDDYGTGYSNLSYLIDYPVKLIKIDKSIVQSCLEMEKVGIAMESTILMIKKLNLKVVAEGVETKEQLERMNQLGIDFIQGFYFSKPLEKENFLKELKES